MQWIISMEQPDGSWEPTGEVFEGTSDDVSAHLGALHQSTGVCHSATLKQ